MSRALRITLAIVAISVAIGAVYFRGLHRRVLDLARPHRVEEQARREMAQPPVTTPTDVKEKAKIFWLAEENAESLQAVEVELSLSTEPVLRAKQVLLALIALPLRETQRTVPADAVLLEFYLLPDGTAIADFSDALARNTPSGILSEQLTVDSIARTLEANVPGARRLKILINGQETETLAGHVDLGGFFELKPSQPAEAPAPALTPVNTPGKL